MKYVSIYGNAIATICPSPRGYAKDITLRYPIFVPFNGEKYKIRLDNYCCDEAVTISKVLVSKGSSLSDACEDNFITLTANGKEEFFMEGKGNITSDEFSIDVKENEYLVITMYLKDFTCLTSGVTTKGIYSKGFYGQGDQSRKTKFDINTSKSTSWFYFLSDVYAYTQDSNEALICFGDSITAQDYPDYLLKSLRDRGINNVSVIRKAVSGTRVLRQYECLKYRSYGLKGEYRFNREISAVMGAKKLLILHGINDIIHPVGEDINIFRPLSDLPSVEELAKGIEYYKNEAKKYDLDVYVGTLTPFYKWRTYDLSKEELKNSYNTWIRENNKCVDFSSRIAYFNGEAFQYKDGFDSGDHLHPSNDCYIAMGDEASKIY